MTHPTRDPSAGQRELSRRLAASLAESFDAALRWLEVDDDVWRARAGARAGNWTVAQICEHLTLVDHYLLVLVDKLAAKSRRRLEAGERPGPQPSALEQLEPIARRERPWDAPEHMLPTGTCTRADIRARLEDDRRRCLAHLRELPAGEGTLHRIRFSVVGQKLDLYQFLRVIDLHTRRHLAQMERAARA